MTARELAEVLLVNACGLARNGDSTAKMVLDDIIDAFDGIEAAIEYAEECGADHTAEFLKGYR